MSDILKLLEMVGENYIGWLMLVELKELTVCTKFHGNHSYKACPIKLKKIADLMLKNQIAQVDNFEGYKYIRFEGNEAKRAEIMSRLFGDLLQHQNGKYRLDVKIDGIRIQGSVDEDVYESLKVAA